MPINILAVFLIESVRVFTFLKWAFLLRKVIISFSHVWILSSEGGAMGVICWVAEAEAEDCSNQFHWNGVWDRALLWVHFWALPVSES